MSKTDSGPSAPPTLADKLTITTKNLLERIRLASSSLSQQQRMVELQQERYRGALVMLDRKMAYFDKLAADLLTSDKPIAEDHEPPTWEDATLMVSLRKANWDDFKARGATNEQIASRLLKSCHWADYVGYSTEAAAHFVAPKEYVGNAYRVAVGKATFYIGTGGSRNDQILLHERTGAALFKDIRRLLQIPEPKKPTKTPQKAPTKSAAKPAAKKAAAAPKGGPAFRKQTFGQWIATAHGCLGKDAPPIEEMKTGWWKAAWEDGQKPGDAARDAKNCAEQAKPAAKPRLPHLRMGQPQTVQAPPLPPTGEDEDNDPAGVIPATTRFTPDGKGGGILEHPDNPPRKLTNVREIRVPAQPAPQRERMSLQTASVQATHDELKKGFSWGTLQDGRIRQVFDTFDGDAHYVVTGMTLRSEGSGSDLFKLSPVVPIDQYAGPAVSWTARKKATPLGRTMDLVGVYAVEDNTAEKWVFVDEAGAIDVMIPYVGEDAKAGAA